MVIYIFFIILSFLSLIEGEFIGFGRFIFLAFCLPLSIYLYKRKPLEFTLLHTVFIVFLFFATLATFFSPVFGRSLSTLILYFAYFIYFLSAQVLAGEKRKLFRELLIISILFPSLILCFLSLYFLVFSQPPPFGSMNLLFANFGHSHVIDFLLFSFPVSLALFLRENNTKKKIFFGILNLIFLFSFISSFSRGGILMAIFITLVFLLVNKRRLFSLIFLTPLIYFLVLSTSGYYYFGEERIKSFRNFVLARTFRKPSVASRLDYWYQATIAFAQRPIFGWGLDNFRYVSKIYQKDYSSWSWYTHNHFLQMFSDTGILGGISFLIFIYLLLFSLVKRLKNSLPGSTNCTFDKSLNLALVTGLLASTIHSLFDYDWCFNSVFLFFLVIGGYLINLKMSPPNGGERKLPRIYISMLKKAILFLGCLLFLIGILEFWGNLLLLSGVREREKGQDQMAEKYYLRSLAIWPYKLDNWQEVGAFYLKKGENEKAIAVLSKLVTYEPLADKNFDQLAKIYEIQGKNDSAVKNYLQVIKLNPFSDESYYKIIDLWQTLKEPNPQILFEVLRRLEKIKGPNCQLKCLEFVNEKKLENLLLQLIKDEKFNKLNAAQQARVFYWLAILTTYQKNWVQDIDFLNQAISLDKQKEYQDFLNNLILFQKIQADFDAKDYLNVKTTAKVFFPKIENHKFYEKFFLEEIYLILSKISFEEQDNKAASQYRQTAEQINPR